MKLQVRRGKPTVKSIPGELYLNGEFECLTLENRVKAIPAGAYPVALEYSPRFGRVLPELKDIPGRSECKFHPANLPEELEGCIAVGQVASRDFIGRSKAALDALMLKCIAASNRKEPITIEIMEAESCANSSTNTSTSSSSA